MSRRTIALAVGGIIVGLLLLGLALAQRSRTAPEEEASGSFCMLYPKIEDLTAMLERGLEGTARPDDLPPDSFRTTAGLVWTDDVARDGPDHLDGDAAEIARAVRAAAADRDAGAVQTRSVQEAIARVGPGARAACGRSG